jgi:hypothetical protein
MKDLTLQLEIKAYEIGRQFALNQEVYELFNENNLNMYHQIFDTALAQVHLHFQQKQEK